MNDIKFSPFDEFDEECKMPMGAFKQGVEYNCYTDYDGYGYYATESKISNIYIDFDEVLNDNYPSWATHVCWFNK